MQYNDHSKNDEIKFGYFDQITKTFYIPKTKDPKQNIGIAKKIKD